MSIWIVVVGIIASLAQYEVCAMELLAAGKPARLEIRQAGDHSVRVTLMPLSLKHTFPNNPVLPQREYPTAALRIQEITDALKSRVGSLNVEVRPTPLSVTVSTADNKVLQEITFENDGSLSFSKSAEPILGLGEGGPLPARGSDWRKQTVQFDRNGSYHRMIPRWQSDAYGSRNPVAMMIGTEGWGLFIATPWGEIDLQDEERGVFKPWMPDVDRISRRDRERALQGRPPPSEIIPGAFDFFVFDASHPEILMKDVSEIAGAAVMPPKWALGYMQSHRELVDKNLGSEELLTHVVDMFRSKQIPVDAMIYLGTGFTRTGWNTHQPSFTFNPKVFRRGPKQVIDDLHARNVKVITHIVPWDRRRLPTLQGTIPALDGERQDSSHIERYWREHVDLVEAGVDAWWPDEGDWFDLHERMKRHQLYYQGPLLTQPNVRPWSLHRNGHLGISRWGGWVWSGDTQSSWKSLETQIAVGINHSLSLSPYWGSDTGGFFLGVDPPELSGELYARWFQFSAFCPSFRSHGRIWRLRLPYGWGLSDMGDTEGERFPPSESELGNSSIEPICRKYAELRYKLIPYTYTLAAQARESGMPLMRAMWLHYPADKDARRSGDQFLWGRDLLIAPVFQKGAKSRDVYLPEGKWYDFWSYEALQGGKTIMRELDLATMPIYVRAGAIIPIDPVRQFMSQQISQPTRIRVFTGSDGDFRLYEDDGESQAYIKGALAWTRFLWDDDARRLEIRRESNGLESKPRKLVIELVPEGSTKEVQFDGGNVALDFES